MFLNFNKNTKSFFYIYGLLAILKASRRFVWTVGPRRSVSCNSVMLIAPHRNNLT